MTTLGASHQTTRRKSSRLERSPLPVSQAARQGPRRENLDASIVKKPPPASRGATSGVTATTSDCSGGSESLDWSRSDPDEAWTLRNALRCAHHQRTYPRSLAGAVRVETSVTGRQAKANLNSLGFPHLTGSCVVTSRRGGCRAIHGPGTAQPDPKRWTILAIVAVAQGQGLSDFTGPTSSEATRRRCALTSVRAVSFIPFGDEGPAGLTA